MRGRLGLLIVAAAGCGRLGFEGQPPGPAGDAAGAPDGAATSDAALLRGCDVTHPGALLCEGFEAPDVMWDYTIIDQGTVARTTTRAASGAAALEVTTNDALQFKYARWGLNFVLPAVASGDLYVQERIWLSGTTTVTEQLSVMVFGQQADPFPSANVLLTPGKIAVNVQGNNVPGFLEFPRDRWVCVRLHLGVDEVAGSVELSLDDVVVASATAIDTAVTGGYTNVDAGVHYASSNQTAARLWVDEMVADTQPITCD